MGDADRGPSGHETIKSARADAKELAQTGLVTEKQALAYLLRSVYGFQRQQAAHIMDVSPSNFDNIYHRAKSNVESAKEALDKLGNSETQLTADMGGELGWTIRNLIGEQYVCGGCAQVHEVSENDCHGYSHSDGLTDERGRSWWLYVPCPNRSYDNSWKTLQHNHIDDSAIRTGELIIENDTTEQRLSITVRDRETGESLNPEDYPADTLEYEAVAEGIRDIRSPPLTFTYYDFRDDPMYPRAYIGGNWDAIVDPSVTIVVEDDTEADEPPFKQTFSFDELGMEQVDPTENDETSKKG